MTQEEFDKKINSIISSNRSVYEIWESIGNLCSELDGSIDFSNNLFKNWMVDNFEEINNHITKILENDLIYATRS